METNYDINIGYLQNTIKNEEKLEKNEKFTKKETDKYISKLVEYDFFVKNEIEVSKILNNNTEHNDNDERHCFLTIQKWDFVKLCESNKQILEKVNIQLNSQKKIVLLKYKNVNMIVDEFTNFINSFFFHNLINNTSIFPENPRTSQIFWNFIRIYEDLLDDLSYLNKKGIQFIDFSSKNLCFNKEFYVYFTNFEKCLIKQKFHILDSYIANISNIDNNVTGDNELVDLQHYYSGSANTLQNIAKYVKIENYVDKFIKIMEKIDYYGNKHFDLYFFKQLIKTKNFHDVFKNLDPIIDNYFHELYFMKGFSDKFKKDVFKKWKIQIKINIEKNIRFLNIDVEKISWKMYLFLILERRLDLGWEIFSLNSLFMNITYYMLKIFDIDDKSSVVHRYFKYLFTNMDINSCLFYENNNMNNYNDIINNCLGNYNKFRGSFEISKDFDDATGFYCFSHVTNESHRELYELLLKIVETF